MVQVTRMTAGSVWRSRLLVKARGTPASELFKHGSLPAAHFLSEMNDPRFISGVLIFRRRITTIGKIGLGVGAVAVVANVGFLASAIPAVAGIGAPYLPTFDKTIHFVFDKVLPSLLLEKLKAFGCSFNNGSISRNKREDKATINIFTPTIIDLGSGDGRVVMEAHRRGYRSIGYEINPILIVLSNLLLLLDKLQSSVAKDERMTEGTASFVRKDIWRVTPSEIAQADVIFVYGLGPIMDRLAEKLHHEAQENVLIVSNVFEMKSKYWDCVFHDINCNVHVYRRKQKDKGKS